MTVFEIWVRVTSHRAHMADRCISQQGFVCAGKNIRQKKVIQNQVETERIIFFTSSSAVNGERPVCGVNHANGMIPAALLPVVAQHIRTHRPPGWLAFKRSLKRKLQHVPQSPQKRKSELGENTSELGGYRFI